LFFLYVSCLHRDLHSFPTRRSSDLVYISEISREVSVVKHFYRSVIQDGIGKQEHRHIGSPPWSVNRKKTQSDSLYIVQMAIGIRDRKSTRLNSSHVKISYAVFCLKK